MALKTRTVSKDDIPFLRELHEKYYSEFEMIDFTKLLNGFVIETEKDEFVMAGGVKPLAETLLMTDKEMPMTTIGRALVEAQMISMYTCDRFQIEDLIAFVNDENYAKHLIKHGFQRRNNISLFMRVNNGR
jgi:hypothetical protein